MNCGCEDDPNDMELDVEDLRARVAFLESLVAVTYQGKRVRAKHFSKWNPGGDGQVIAVEREVLMIQLDNGKTTTRNINEVELL
jgi:hypothetical protein